MDTNARCSCGRLAACLTVAFIATAAGAQTTWHVDGANACPGDGSKADPFCAIQPAINASSNGDEVIVAPGTYNEAINFSGRAIHLASSGGPEVTIIDASGLGTSVVTCEVGETSTTILDGFTITGGSAPQGGGMRNLFSSPTVINCIFTGNVAASGGAISNSSGSDPVITNCRFENNTASNNGGGIENIHFSTAVVNDSIFAGNSANSGGAIWNSGGTFCNSHVAGTTFCENDPNDIFGTWHDNGGNEFLKECPSDCPIVGDINCDGVVNGLDLLILLAAWGDCADPDDCPADLNDDNVVDGLDLLIMLGNWG